MSIDPILRNISIAAESQRNAFEKCGRYKRCGFIMPGVTLDLNILDSSVHVKITNLTPHRVVYGIRLNGTVVLTSHNFAFEKIIEQNTKGELEVSQFIKPELILPHEIASLAISTYQRLGIDKYADQHQFLTTELAILPKALSF